MTGLSELLERAVDDQPGDALSPDHLLELGRSRVRRRRLLAGAAAAAVVVLAAAPVAVHSLRTSPHPPAPASPGRVLRLADATAGQAGRDYRSIGSVTNGELGDATSDNGVQGVLTDGRLVVVEMTGRTHVTGRNGLLDPGTGKVQWFPPDPVGPYVGQDGDRLVFGLPLTGRGDLTEAGDTGYQVLDLATMTWSSLPVQGDVDQEWLGSTQSQLVSDGWLYVAMNRAPTRQLWRVALDGRSAWQQVARVGAFDVHDATLAYTDSLYDAGHVVGTHSVTLRDLATGTERQLPVPDAADCATDALTLGPGDLLLSLACRANLPGADRLQLLALDGRPLATVSAGYLVAEGLGDDVVAFGVPAGGDNPGDLDAPGTYVYHPSTGALVRLGEHASPVGGGGRRSLPLLLWDGDLIPTPQQRVQHPGDVAFEVVVPR